MKGLNISLVPLIIYAFCSCSSKYKVFVPVISAEHGLVMSDQIEPEFYPNLEIVLKYYHEDYKVVSGIIYIDRAFYEDNLELMMNYTNKARDTLFIKYPEKAIHPLDR